MPVNTTIQIRKGTATEWSSPNPVLGSGEPGFDTTNNLLKIGDGSTAWNSLASANLSSPTLTGTVTISGGQIAFPATANLSGNANTLDDYERGNWTPTFIASTTNPTVTYDAITYGIYLKIGLMVFISGSVVLTAASGGSGDLRIGGLPFVARNGTTGGYGSLALGFRSGWTTTTPGTAYVQASASYIQLYTTLVTASITTANLSATSYIQFSGFYRTTT